MILYLLDSNFNRIAVIDQYVSLIWTDRYWDIGDFELYVNANTDIPYSKGLYLQKADDTTGRLMRIEEIKLTEDEENGDYFTISGAGFEKILASRIVWNKTRITGNAEACLYNLFRECFSISTITGRNIAALSVAELKGLAGNMSGVYNGDELLEIVMNTCKECGFGFRLNNFVFEIYKGADRSFNQNVNDFVVFSPDFGNLAKSDYTQDISAQKNVCLAYSESSQTAYGRLMYTAGSGSGLNRHEVFTDCGNEEDTLILETAAEDMLAQTEDKNAFEGEIIVKSGWQNDFGLGDIVQLANDYGNTGKVRITEIIESDSAEGYSIIPTFEVVSE